LIDALLQHCNTACRPEVRCKSVAGGGMAEVELYTRGGADDPDSRGPSLVSRRELLPGGERARWGNRPARCRSRCRAHDTLDCRQQ
jgi:hypothetical protein